MKSALLDEADSSSAGQQSGQPEFSRSQSRVDGPLLTAGERPHLHTADSRNSETAETWSGGSTVQQQVGEQESAASNSGFFNGRVASSARVVNGRCSVCTLQPPCKHLNSIDIMEEQQEQQDKQEAPPSNSGFFKGGVASSSTAQQQQSSSTGHQQQSSSTAEQQHRPSAQSKSGFFKGSEASTAQQQQVGGQEAPSKAGFLGGSTASSAVREEQQSRLGSPPRSGFFKGSVASTAGHAVDGPAGVATSSTRDGAAQATKRITDTTSGSPSALNQPQQQPNRSSQRGPRINQSGVHEENTRFAHRRQLADKVFKLLDPSGGRLTDLHALQIALGSDKEGLEILQEMKDAAGKAID